MSSNLIDVDLRGYEPEEEPEEAQPKVPEFRPIGRVFMSSYLAIPGPKRLGKFAAQWRAKGT